MPISAWGWYFDSADIGSGIFDQMCSGTMGIVPSTCWRNVASGRSRRNSTERSPVGTTSAPGVGTPTNNGVKVCEV